MPDIIDKANEYAEIDLEVALRKRREEGPKATGYCLYCREPLQDRRFCDAACRDDYELEEARAKQRKASPRLR